MYAMCEAKEKFQSPIKRFVNVKPFTAKFV